MGNHLSFLPDGATIPWPSYTKALDYELELELVIAHPIRNTTPEDAIAAIGGSSSIHSAPATCNTRR